MTPGEWPHSPATLRRIAAHLAARPGRAGDAAGRRTAAVAVGLVPHEATAAFLLTRRTAGLRRHAGQYALPGGRIDPGETAEQAALRELAEELGIAAGPDSVLGRLDDLPTASGWLVTPLVLWLGAAELRPDPVEVEAVFRIPLGELFARPAADAPKRIAPEPGVLWQYLPSLGHEVYAPTAAILHQFREVALMGRDAEMQAFREPGFARR